MANPEDISRIKLRLAEVFRVFLKDDRINTDLIFVDDKPGGVEFGLNYLLEGFPQVARERFQNVVNMVLDPDGPGPVSFQMMSDDTFQRKPFLFKGNLDAFVACTDWDDFPRAFKAQMTDRPMRPPGGDGGRGGGAGS